MVMDTAPRRCGQFFQASAALCLKCGLPDGHKGSHGNCDQDVLQAARDVSAERITLSEITLATNAGGLWLRPLRELSDEDLHKAIPPRGATGCVLNRIRGVIEREATRRGLAWNLTGEGVPR